MQFEHLKTLLRSLRFRLSAWNTAVVLLAVVVAMLFIREGLRITLDREADQLLRDDAAEVAAAVEHFYPKLDEIYNEMNRKAEGHNDRGLFVQLIDPQQEVLWSSGNVPQLGGLAALTQDGQEFASLPDHRVLQRSIDHAGIPSYTIRVGSSLDGVQHDVDNVTSAMSESQVNSSPSRLNAMS